MAYMVLGPIFFLFGSDKLNPTGLSVEEYQVGIEHPVEQVSKFLRLWSNSNDVGIVAIWGIGGMGKTTIAKAVYNRIHRKFESSSFLANVGRTSRDTNGVVKLQKQLLSDLLKDENVKIRCEYRGIEVIKSRAWGRRGRRVLLVLDDVDNDNQLSALAIDRDLLCPGSRIIVTTRDLSSLSPLRLDKVNEVYKLDVLEEHESLQLFSWHAFGRDGPLEGYKILSKEVVSYAKGLPLLIKSLGSSLKGKTVPKWKSTLKKLEKIPDLKVQKILRVSYDSLGDKEKCLFLDIACFFVGMDQDLVIKILEGCGFYPYIDIDILSDRCLVSIDWHNQLMMHDLIQDMAKEIIRQESPEEPGRRSRLWYHEDILDVLRYDTGTENVLGLVLNLPESKELQVNAEAFTKMKSLRLLHLNYVQVLDKLKYLNLSHSHLLIKTPDFTGLTSLEKLLLNDCKKLVEVHHTIGRLKDLIVLDMKNCKNLKKIPLSIFMLKSLVDFNMSGCSKLEWPAFFQESPPKSSFSSLQLSSSIRELSMENCNITNVPSETGSLVSLEYLNLSRNKFSNLPATITSLPLLEYLSVNKCTLLESLPALPVNLVELWANDSTSLQNMSIIDSKAAHKQFKTFNRCPKLVNNNAAYNFRRNVLRYQGHREEELHISFPGGEVPRWCNYQSNGYFIRFRMPQLVGRIIQGIIVCFVFSRQKCYSNSYFRYASYCISNKTRLSGGPHSDEVHVILRADEFGQMCLSYIPIRHLKHCWLDAGDEVEITIRQVVGEDLRVKRLGVSLIYEGDEENEEFITLPTGVT
ncbi:disease resistance protein RPV1-like [Cornus florida]|uniref:disease resistance protein RPV1-like n=1 Tax=Cornus florida TaxID=4283 RepID=UPI00289C774E|nr:disease resistance protein RPV1-like [Cornus florida]